MTSDTPGLPLVVDGQEIGKTPLEVQVAYNEREERISSGKFKTGWWVLLVGLALSGAGGAGAGWGIWRMSDAAPCELTSGESFGLGILSTMGIVTGLVGLATLWMGISDIATSPPITDRVIAEPPITSVVVTGSDGKKWTRNVSLSPIWPAPRIGEVGRLHFFDKPDEDRPCRLRVASTPAGLQVQRKQAKGPPLVLGAAPLEIPCKVRSSLPRAALYDRKDRPLFQPVHALQLPLDAAKDKSAVWQNRTGVLDLLVAVGGRTMERRVYIDADRVWKEPEVRVTLQADALPGTSGVEVTYSAPAASQPASGPSSRPAGAPAMQP